ncbi:hypothetical protein KG090_03785 [Carnobacteriaceae bacterium zg-ZUI240]|nr:hypothetical protein [Carnobacteriaceae bacterium zg-ZUI240]
MITYESLCEKVGIDILVGTDKPLDENGYEDKPSELSPEEEKFVTGARNLTEEEWDLCVQIRITKDKTLTA